MPQFIPAETRDLLQPPSPRRASFQKEDKILSASGNAPAHGVEECAMKFHIGLALFFIALLLPVAALARDNNSHSVVIPSKVMVAGQQLKPGNYKVEWLQTTGPEVEVQFIKDGSKVVTAPGTLKTNDAQVTQDDIITEPTATSKNALTEIDFGHQKEAILFAPSKS